MNIALIAMSGIRCDDKELASFGLSLPGLLDRGKTIASLPSLALLTLAGLTSATWITATRSSSAFTARHRERRQARRRSRETWYFTGGTGKLKGLKGKGNLQRYFQR